MRTQETHSAASLLALIFLPGCAMLLASLISGFYPKPPIMHVGVVLAVGAAWHGMGRRWLEKNHPSSDSRLSRTARNTLFVALPAAFLVVFLIVLGGGAKIQAPAITIAAALGFFPQFMFYID